MTIVFIIFAIATVIATALAYTSKNNRARNYLICSILCAITAICCFIDRVYIGGFVMGIAMLVNLSGVYNYRTAKKPRG